MPATSLFDQLDRVYESEGVEPSLDLLEGHFRRQREYFRLFEVLKLRVRQRLSLPIVASGAAEQLPERIQKQLDDGLIDACQTVGTLLFRDGNIQHGWTYLQPTGNRKLAESLIKEVAVDEENTDMLIDIALSQGGAPTYGYQLAIKHHGTCSAITAFDVQAAQFDRATQAAMAAALLHHLYGEVIENMRNHIEQQNESPRDDASLRELLAEHPWLVEQQAYHLDATHLASLMKIARLTTSASEHDLALQLAEYGAGFPEDFQYPNPAPFENTYRDHQIFFRALLGEDVDAAVAHFKQKASTTDREVPGSQTDEVLIDFLCRVGRVDEAITHATAQPIDPAMRTGLAADVTEMAETPEQTAVVLEHLKQQDDLLGYSIALFRQAVSGGRQ